jgi:transposase-like protein
MRRSTETADKVCPKCGSTKGQAKAGHTDCGSRRIRCFACKCRYTLNPKSVAYPEEKRELAIKEYLSGISGRGVGKIHGMSGNNVINWLKKTSRGVDKP